MLGIKRLGLLVIFAAISACSTVKEQAPVCSPVVVPVLPALDKGAMWDKLGDEHYREVETYINTLWEVIDKQRVITNSVC